MWMNDPNGMVFYDREYHLFYQHNPEDIVWGPMHWGHAVSKDLVHWEHLPIALYPDEHGLIFSGSAVVDWKNTSGLGSGRNPPLVAIFTYHLMEGEQPGRNDFQTQGIAFSNDKGRTWIKYEDNPVLENPGIRDFRDPKVIWYEERKKWIMVFAAGDHVRFYSSTNLIDWTFESIFGRGIGAHGGVWECPDLFPLEVTGEKKWVLLVSINPGGPNGGSATQYFTGSFDGTTFTNDNPDDKILWLDYGRDNYAGVTWSDIPEDDGRRIFIGWMSNWSYATAVPTGTWCSAMTIARTLELVSTEEGFRLISQPVEEINTIRCNRKQLGAKMLTGESEVVEADLNGATELVLEFKLSNGTQFGWASQFGVKLSNNLGEEMVIGYEPTNNRFFTDRSKAGKSDFNNGFAEVHYAPYANNDNTIKLHLFIDVASAELFAEDGKVVMTDIFFPNEDFNKVTIFAKNGSVKLSSGQFFALLSVW
jgi:fructan beta-fructosidase